MFSIEIFQTATDDLQEAFDWYEEQSTGLGERFVNEVDDHLDLIRKNPYQFAVQFSGKYRFALLGRFPFRIVYRIDGAKEHIYVSAYSIQVVIPKNISSRNIYRQILLDGDGC